MSDLKQETIFTNIQLDTDTDQRFMSVGAAPYHCNILVGEEGSNAVVTNMKGNKQGSVSYPLTNANVYLVVGSYYNRLTRKVYYFIFSQPYDSTGSEEYLYDNKLLCYNEDEETIDCIFTDTKNYFGLHFNHFMKDCEMIGDWLFFNPRVSEPKMIDVEKAYNYENYDAYDATLSYIYGDKVIYKGGLFVANTSVNVGESPVNTVAKWDKMGDAYQDETNLDFTSEFYYAFNVIKQPPIVRPTIAFGSYAGIQSNNIRNKMFRFAYRYKYFDNSYSVYSAFSDVSLSPQSEQWDGEIVDDMSLNNYIAVTISLHSAALVKEVEIVTQEVGKDWRRIKVVNRQEQGELETNNFTYNFFNSESSIIVDSTELYRIYDAVPRTTNTQAIINKNVLCYGGSKEGFTNLNKEDIDVTLTPELQTYADSVSMVSKRNNIGNDITQSAVYNPIFYTIIDISDYVAWGVVAGDKYSIIVNGNVATTDAFIAGDVATATTLATAIIEVIPSTGLILSVGGAGSDQVWIGQYYSYPEVTASLFFTPASAAEETYLYKKRGFKTGANHPFCIFYYDDNLRRWDAQTSKENIPGAGLSVDGTTVYVPMLTEVSSPAINLNVRWTIDWEVGHLPPDGAKYWRWGYAGNTLCSYFVQYVISGITFGDHTTTLAPTTTAHTTTTHTTTLAPTTTHIPENMAAIHIDPLQRLRDVDYYTVYYTGGSAVWGNVVPNSNIEPYTWQKGDRIRFITEAKGSFDPWVIGGSMLGDVLKGIYDYEILRQSDDGDTIYIQGSIFDLGHVIGYSDNAGLYHVTGENCLVEIYRPLDTSSSSDIVYYEFGNLMPIIEDSGGYMVHGGITQNQDYLADNRATGTFDYGDVYHIIRTPSRPLDFIIHTANYYAFHESMWYSDFYDSSDWDRGKPGEETIFGERNLNIIRYSLQFMQNTQINGLSTFLSENYKELNDIYGDIKAIMEIGNTLKCYQRTKPSSILIGRQEYTDTEGNTTVATSTSVLGSIRYSTTNYGTEFPESLSRNNRYVYGYDIYNATVFRDSANGIFPISGRFVTTEGDTDYKMSSFFKDISKSLMLSGIVNVKVMTVWDEEYKMLYISFHDAVNEDNNKTVVFHEPSNKWLCFAEFEIVNHNGYNVILELTYDILKGFQGGIGYEFDEETRFAIFNIVTGSGVLGYFGTIGLSFEALEPTVMLSSNPSQDMIDLLFTPQEPTVYISFTHLSKTDIEWDYDEYGLPESQDLEVDTSESYCTITAKPTWLIVMLIDTPLYVGSTIPDGATLFLAPLVENTGPELNDTFTVEDAWGNSASLAVKHRENLAGVTVYVLATTPPPLIVTDNGCTGTYGSANIVINFTPNSPEHTLGQTYTVDYTITKNGSSAGTGTISVTEEQANTQTLTMGSTAVNGDIINVYLEYNE